MMMSLAVDSNTGPGPLGGPGKLSTVNVVLGFVSSLTSRYVLPTALRIWLTVNPSPIESPALFGSPAAPLIGLEAKILLETHPELRLNTCQWFMSAIPA